MLDPPYWSPRSGPQDYAVRFSQQDHEDLAEILYSIQGKFLLTYDDSVTVRDAYDRDYIKPHNFRYSVPHAGSAGESTIGQELIITNYDTAQVMGPLFAVQELDIIV
jgi:DNA adenine methylase